MHVAFLIGMTIFGLFFHAAIGYALGFRAGVRWAVTRDDAPRSHRERADG